METNSVKAKFEELLNKQEEIKREFQKVAQSMLKESFKEFWELNPGIKAVRWTQYTPYFNDGEPCEFGIGDVYFSNAEGEDLNDLSSYGEYDGENENVVSLTVWGITSDHEYCKNESDILKAGGIDEDSITALDKLIHSKEMENVLLMMFDDHVYVTATRDGFTTDEYQHD